MIPFVLSLLVISVIIYWSKNVAQMFPKVAQIDATVVFTQSAMFKLAQKVKIIAKNIKKSPNQVILIVIRTANNLSWS